MFVLNSECILNTVWTSRAVNIPYNMQVNTKEQLIGANSEMRASPRASSIAVHQGNAKFTIGKAFAVRREFLKFTAHAQTSYNVNMRFCSVRAYFFTQNQKQSNTHTERVCRIYRQTDVAMSRATILVSQITLICFLKRANKMLTRRTTLK